MEWYIEKGKPKAEMKDINRGSYKDLKGLSYNRNVWKSTAI